MRLDLMCLILQDAGVGKVGKTLFRQTMPPDCTKGVILRNPPDGVAIDQELPGYYRCQIQAIARAQTYETGNDLVERVMNVLNFTNRPVLDGSREAMFVNRIRPTRLPITYPRSDGNGREFSTYFDCSYVMRSFG